MGGLILGVITLYRVFCFFKLFIIGGKELRLYLLEPASYTMKLLSGDIGICLEYSKQYAMTCLITEKVEEFHNVTSATAWLAM